jgi:hypothetical protein
MKFDISLVSYTATSKGSEATPWSIRVGNKYIPITKPKLRADTYIYSISLEDGKLHIMWGSVYDDSRAKSGFKIFYLPWSKTFLKEQCYMKEGKWMDLPPYKIGDNKRRESIEEDREVFESELTVCYPGREPVTNTVTYHMERRFWVPKIFKDLKIPHLAPKTHLDSIEIKFSDYSFKVWSLVQGIEEGEDIHEAFCRIIHERNFKFD